MKENLDELTLLEVEEFGKELKDYLKDRKSEEKEATIGAFKTSVEVGDEVTFRYKDGEETGEVKKINDKTFTVEFDIDGDTVKRAIQFHRYVGKASPADEEAVA